MPRNDGYAETLYAINRLNLFQDNFMNIIIKQLTPDLLNDYLYYFDKIGFADNKEWEGCYCVFHHHQNNFKDWVERSKDENRNLAIKLINDNKLKGFLAYDNDKSIAWCNVNEKILYSFNKTIKKIETDLDNEIISIVCFLVSHKYRRQGVSSKLLNHIINFYKNTNKNYIEAYPFKNTTKDSENCHGPLSLYLKNNFYIDKEHENYTVVKYKLNKERD